MRRGEAPVGEVRGQAPVLLALLGARGGVPPERGGANLRLEETQRGLPREPVHGPTVRLQLPAQGVPLARRDVHQARRRAQEVEDLVLPEPRPGARDERRRLRHERGPEPTLPPIERRVDEIGEVSGKRPRLLARRPRVPARVPHERVHLPRRDEEVQRRPRVAGVERRREIRRGVHARRGIGGPAADALEREVHRRGALRGRHRGHVQDLQDLAASLAQGVDRAAPRAGDDDADGEGDGGGEPIVRLDAPRLRAVEAVEEDDDLAEQRRVREEARERGRDLVQRRGEVDVDVEPGLELGAQAEQDAAEVVRLAREAERVRQDERLGLVRGRGRGGRGRGHRDGRVGSAGVGVTARAGFRRAPSPALNLRDERREGGGFAAPGWAEEEHGVGIPHALDVLVQGVHERGATNRVRGVPLHRHDVQVPLELRGRPLGRGLGHAKGVRARDVPGKARRVRVVQRRARAADVPRVILEATRLVRRRRVLEPAVSHRHRSGRRGEHATRATMDATARARRERPRHRNTRRNNRDVATNGPNGAIKFSDVSI